MNIQFYRPLLIVLVMTGIVHAQLPASPGVEATFTYLPYPSDNCETEFSHSPAPPYQIQFRFMIPSEHANVRSGNVFVAFRYDKTPSNQLDTELDESWFYNTQQGWIKQAPGLAPISYGNVINPNHPYLLPIIALVNIASSSSPTDLANLEGKGELMVGYGLLSSSGNSSQQKDAESYQEMVAHDRYSTILSVGSSVYRTPFSAGSRLCSGNNGMDAHFSKWY